MPTIAYRQLFASATAARRRCRGRGSGALRVAQDLKAEPGKPLGIGEEVDRDDLPSVMVKTKTTRACRRPARPRRGPIYERPPRCSCQPGEGVGDAHDGVASYSAKFDTSVLGVIRAYTPTVHRDL
jgi:hypothetical protein